MCLMCDRLKEIPVINSSGYRFMQHRWTSRLGLEQVQNLEELLLETEPEWRLFEDLMALGARLPLTPVNQYVCWIKKTPMDASGSGWKTV